MTTPVLVSAANTQLDEHYFLAAYFESTAAWDTKVVSKGATEPWRVQPTMTAQALQDLGSVWVSAAQAPAAELDLISETLAGWSGATGGGGSNTVAFSAASGEWAATLTTISLEHPARVFKELALPKWAVVRVGMRFATPDADTQVQILWVSSDGLREQVVYSKVHEASPTARDVPMLAEFLPAFGRGFLRVQTMRRQPFATAVLLIMDLTVSVQDGNKYTQTPSSYSGLAKGSNFDIFATDAVSRQIFAIDDGAFARVLAGKQGVSGCADDMQDPFQATFTTPAGVYFSGNKLYVADRGCNAVRVIELTGDNKAAGVWTLQPTSSSLSSPSSVVVQGDRKFLYVTDTGNNRVKRVDLQTFAMVTVGPNGGHIFETPVSLALSPDSSRLFVGSAVERKLLVVSTGNVFAAVTEMSVPAVSPDAIAIDSTGGSIMLASGRERGLHRLDLECAQGFPYSLFCMPCAASSSCPADTFQGPCDAAGPNPLHRPCMPCPLASRAEA
eukprot:2077344-Rhodomonas_salina.1